MVNFKQKVRPFDVEEGGKCKINWHGIFSFRSTTKQLFLTNTTIVQESTVLNSDPNEDDTVPLIISNYINYIFHHNVSVYFIG